MRSVISNVECQVSGSACSRLTSAVGRYNQSEKCGRSRRPVEPTRQVRQCDAPTPHRIALLQGPEHLSNHSEAVLRWTGPMYKRACFVRCTRTGDV